MEEREKCARRISRDGVKSTDSLPTSLFFRPPGATRTTSDSDSQSAVTSRGNRAIGFVFKGGTVENKFFKAVKKMPEFRRER